ncbi:MAG: hypothetical protein WDN25_17970 [Acetobacteraceae bacterium]
MFPLVAIGGVIGAVVSVARGVSWLAEQLDSSRSSGSAAAKSEVKTAGEAKPSPFEAVFAAQVAGQKAPVGTPAAISSPLVAGPEYDTVARMKAGMIAYSHIGERHGSHAKPLTGTVEDRPVAQA